jgi:hypothetical protein
MATVNRTVNFIAAALGIFSSSYIGVVMNQLKGSGAKGLTCSLSETFTTRNGMTDYYEKNHSQ